MMDYLIYMYHGDLKIKEGRWIRSGAFQTFHPDGKPNGYHTKCPIAPMVKYRGKMVCNDERMLPRAIEMFLKSKDEWWERYEEWFHSYLWSITKEREEKKMSKKETNTIELLKDIGEIVFKEGDERTDIIRILADAGYQFERRVVRRRSYNAPTAPDQISVVYTIYERTGMEV